MRYFLSFAIMIAASAPFAAAQFATTTPTTITRESSYPPLGLASTETMQVNLVNLASNATSSTGTVTTAASCTGSVAFLNTTGATIGVATPFNVSQNSIVSVTLPFTKSSIAGVRGEVRVVITTTTPTGKNTPPCALETSLETYDTTTGATHIFLANAAQAVTVPPVATPAN